MFLIYQWTEGQCKPLSPKVRRTTGGYRESQLTVSGPLQVLLSLARKYIYIAWNLVFFMLILQLPFTETPSLNIFCNIAFKLSLFSGSLSITVVITLIFICLFSSTNWRFKNIVERLKEPKSFSFFKYTKYLYYYFVLYYFIMLVYVLPRFGVTSF